MARIRESSVAVVQIYFHLGFPPKQYYFGDTALTLTTTFLYGPVLQHCQNNVIVRESGGPSLEQLQWCQISFGSLQYGGWVCFHKDGHHVPSGIGISAHNVKWKKSFAVFVSYRRWTTRYEALQHLCVKRRVGDPTLSTVQMQRQLPTGVGLRAPLWKLVQHKFQNCTRLCQQSSRMEGQISIHVLDR